MTTQTDNRYIEINRNSWNIRLEEHLKSPFYNMSGFLDGDSSLNRFELDLLGDVEGKSILHLQCHFGQDSISLARLGAEVTGVDLSDKSIEKARELASATGVNAEFVCCNLYDLPKHLNKQFDVVFTSYGTVIWLPDLAKWANIVQHFLKPEGQFVYVDFHPVVWMFDDDVNKVVYPYQNKGAIEEVEEGTYANPDADITQANITWNHALSEVVGSLLRKGLHIQALEEYDYAPYSFVKHCEEYEPGKYRIKHHGNNLPLVYSILAQKPSEWKIQ